MGKINDGGPAFPNVPDGAGDKWSDWDQGMTLRDYFAAKAMLSLIGPMIDGVDDPRFEELVSAQAYMLADAMLEARKK